jgi:hypothetical protein
MHTCELNEMKQYVINCGYEHTDDIFIVEGNLYMKFVQIKQYAIRHPHKVMEYRQSSTYVYFCWNYETKVRRYLTYDQFKIQFDFFQFMKENHSDFIDKLLTEILDHDLTSIMINSIHL